MRLSTKTRYGVRALFDIAFHVDEPGGGAIQAKDIARRENIPLRYLEQIFQDLKRSGLVESKRGPRGGYFLKREPGQITLADIVSALQGPIEDMFVLGDEDAVSAQDKPCARSLTCTLWKDLADHVQGWFAGITIADLVKRADDLGISRTDADQPMYYI